jgi:hypothetical protein
MPDTAVEAWTGSEGCRRDSRRRGNPPVGDDHKATGKTEPVAGAGDGPLVGQMLGDLLETTPDEPVEGLQEEDGLADSVEQLPGRIAACQVGQLVSEETLLVFLREVADSLGTADFRTPDSGGEGDRDRL